jgi:hypothetical protein
MFIKTLWHLAFTEPNRKRIKDAEQGLDVLQSVLNTKDEVLKFNVAGILYVLATPKHPE